MYIVYAKYSVGTYNKKAFVDAEKAIQYALREYKTFKNEYDEFEEKIRPLKSEDVLQKIKEKPEYVYAEFSVEDFDHSLIIESVEAED
jgi:hypothetical protein